MAADPAVILVVDDIAENRELLVRRLQRQGHRVQCANDGAEALAAMKGPAAGPGFDLVLLDIMMPVMDGYQVLEAMKADPALAGLPVVVISAVGEIESVVRCIGLGAEDYLTKPFDPVLLKARVEATIEKKRLRDREREILRELAAEQEKTERLLHSVFPASVAKELKGGPRMIAESVAEATILFADIHDFSRLARNLTPTEMVGLLGRIFGAFDKLAEKHGVEKIKSVADAYMAAAGVPKARVDHARAIAELALDMQGAMARIDTGLREPMSLRIGIHSGPVVAGVICTSRYSYDMWGPTVKIASQMETFGMSGAIQTSAAVHEKLKHEFVFEKRGEFYISGAGELTTYLLKAKR